MNSQRASTPGAPLMFFCPWLFSIMRKALSGEAKAKAGTMKVGNTDMSGYLLETFTANASRDIASFYSVCVCENKLILLKINNYLMSNIFHGTSVCLQVSCEDTPASIGRKVRVVVEHPYDKVSH